MVHSRMAYDDYINRYQERWSTIMKVSLSQQITLMDPGSYIHIKTVSNGKEILEMRNSLGILI